MRKKPRTIQNYGTAVSYPQFLTACAEQSYDEDAAVQARLSNQVREDLLRMSCIRCALNAFDCRCTTEEIASYLLAHPGTVR